MDYAKALAPFREVLDSHDGAHAAVAAIERLEQNKGCSISYAADMCQGLADGLVKAGLAESRTGRVTGANWNSDVSIVDGPGSARRH